MIGNGVPIRFSRRIGKKASLLPVKVYVKKTRRSPVKKRASVGNYSLLKATVQTKAVRNNKPEKGSMHTSRLHSSLKVTEKSKIGKKSKSEKNSNQLSKQVSCNLRRPAHKISTKGISKICGQKRNTRNSLKASQINLSHNEQITSLLKKSEKNKVSKKSKSEKNSKQISKQASYSLKPASHKRSGKAKFKIFGQRKKKRNVSQYNLTEKEKQQNRELKLFNEKKKVIEKKNRTKFAVNKKRSVRRSLRVSNSSLLVKGKRTTKELNVSKLKSPKMKKYSQKKCSLKITRVSPKSVPTPNTGKSTRISRHSERKKSAGLSAESLNQEISIGIPSSKSLPITPYTEKVTRSFKMPLSKKSENLPFDVLLTPPFTPINARTISKRCLSKSNSKSSKREFHVLATENHVASEEVKDVKKKKKSAGGNVFVDNSTGPPKYRTMKKSFCPPRIDYTKKLKDKRNSESNPTPRMNIQYKIDVLTADLNEKLSQRNARSVPHRNKFNSLSTVRGRKGKSTGNLKRKLLKRVISPVTPLNVNEAFSDIETENKTSPVETYPTKKRNYLIPDGNSKGNIGIKEDCLTADVCEVKHKRANTASSKTKIGTSNNYQNRSFIKILAPIKFTSNECQNPMSSLSNTVIKELSQLPMDNLTSCEDASCSRNDSERLVRNLLIPYRGREKILSLPLGLSSEMSAKDDFSNMPIKGTLKRKRWLLNNLKEKNTAYEDDIFENQNFGLYNTTFHLSDESDGSSVNIATPKFDCILTPALPKKTPRFKDCISPTDLLQARKTAEEYLYRRNKKRKSGDKPSSSGKKTSMNKKNTTRDIPEKKKLVFEEAVNKLIAVQKDLDKNAENNYEEEDSYFSDASN